MKKLWLLPLLLLILVACQESLEDRCAREAQEFTKRNCPLRMDKNINVDSLTFERDTHTLHYYYTLTGVADRDSVGKEIDAISLLKKELKNSTAMKVYKDNHYRFAYTFRSEKEPSKILIEVVFTDKDY